MNRRPILLLSAALLLALTGGSLPLAHGRALAQSGGDYDVEWSVMGSAGDQFVSGGDYQMGFTLAQDTPPLVSSGGSYQIAQGYWLYEVSAWERCSMSQGETYSFGSVQVEISTLGNLKCLEVERCNENHAKATGTEGGNGTKTGRYWGITPSLGSGESYKVNLTLPHDDLNDPKACKYDSGSGGWDCDRDAFDSTSVTRDGIGALSDWAVGEFGGTVVAIHSFVARSTSELRGPVLLVGLLVITMLGSAWLRRGRRS